MSYRIDRLATPGSDYGYTGIPVMDSFNFWAAPTVPTMPTVNYGLTGAMPAVDYGLPVPPSITPPNSGLNLSALSGPRLDAMTAVPPVGSTGSTGSNWFRDSGFLSRRNTDGTIDGGWGGLAIGSAQALGNLYLGLQQYNLAKDTLANNKAQFERNFNAQRTTTNAQLEDRQRARVAANPGAYQSVGDYMEQNRVR